MDGTILYRRHRTGGGRKVDDNALAGQLSKACVDRDAAHIARITVNTGHDTAVVTRTDFFQQGAAHAAIDALNDDIRHCYVLS